MSGHMRWGASPLSTAVNWLSKEVFGQRQAAKDVQAVQPPPQVTLTPLSLSANSFVIGSPSSGTIVGATAGSTIAVITSLPSGLTIDTVARTWVWSGTGTASTGSFSLTETLAGAIGSGGISVISFSITAGQIVGQANFSLASQSGLIVILEDI